MTKATKDWEATIKRVETELERLKIMQAIAALDEKLALLARQHPPPKS